MGRDERCQVGVFRPQKWVRSFRIPYSYGIQQYGNTEKFNLDSELEGGGAVMGAVRHDW